MTMVLFSGIDIMPRRRCDYLWYNTWLQVHNTMMPSITCFLLKNVRFFRRKILFKASDSNLLFSYQINETY